MRNAKGEIEGRCAPIGFYLTDRLLADEAVFFACGKHKCVPYEPPSLREVPSEREAEGVFNAEGETRKAELRVAALRLYYLIDRLLADEAVFFACGSQECEPYG